MILYRLLIALALPLLMLLQLRQGGGLAERFGIVPRARSPGLWLHGASNGELASAKWLVERLIAERPGLQILITCNTGTAKAMVLGWNLPGIAAAFAPFDTAFATQRLLARRRPAALISLEAELWPNRLAACHAAGVSTILLGARMSARSHGRWRLIRPLIARPLHRIAFASAQDPASRGHLIDLGLPAAAFGADFDLKAQAAASLPPVAPAPREARAATLLAASTHEGEEGLILDAFAASPFSRLILAPRHPARAEAIAALIRARALGFARRSSGALPGEERVFLADTMGEMDLWYARAGATIIGGTFAPKGGHSPWEPIRHASAILHGPNTANFAAPFARLDAAGAALPVTAGSLAGALQTLDAQSQDRLAHAAAASFRATGDADALISRILDLSRPPP